jgi:hypothetical protein
MVKPNTAAVEFVGRRHIADEILAGMAILRTCYVVAEFIVCV